MAKAKKEKQTKKQDPKWFQTGKAGEKRAQQVEDDQKKKGGGRRFWLPEGGTAKVTFLDSEGFYFYEHNIYRQGRWNNFYTCLQDFDNCPLCESGDNPSFVCAFSIIDHRKYHSERLGKDIQHEKKLMVMKQRAYNKLLRRRDSEKMSGDMTLALFDVARGSSDECNTGEDFDFQKKVDKKKLLALAPKELKGDDRENWLTPFNYAEIFAPQSPDFLRRLVGSAPPVGSEEDVGEPETEDDLEEYL